VSYTTGAAKSTDANNKKILVNKQNIKPFYAGEMKFFVTM